MAYIFKSVYLPSLKISFTRQHPSLCELVTVFLCSPIVVFVLLRAGCLAGCFLGHVYHAIYICAGLLSTLWSDRQKSGASGSSGEIACIEGMCFFPLVSFLFFFGKQLYSASIKKQHEQKYKNIGKREKIFAFSPQVQPWETNRHEIISLKPLKF